MPEIQCFLMEKTGRVRRSLRRYSYGDEKCPTADSEWAWGHEASTVLDEVDMPEAGPLIDGTTDWPRDDPRWPTTCACGYQFKENDDWELDLMPIYRRTDTGEERPLFPAEPGQMWFVTWMSGGDPGSIFNQQRGGGAHLLCHTPGGTWDIDSVASNGPGWQRTGDPPNVTAMPSIGIHGAGGSWAYHGWLRDGKLVDA